MDDINHHPASAAVAIPPAGESVQLLLPTGAVITRTGLVFPAGPMDYDHWQETLGIVRRMRGLATWALLDVFKAGRESFGDAKVAEAARSHEVSEEEAHELFRLEPIVVRYAELTPEHHAIVAELDAVDQKRWLECAREYDLTPRDLRLSVKANQVVKAAGTDSINSKQYRIRGTESYLTMINDLSSWRRKSETTIRDWKPDTIRSVLTDFAPVIDFIEDLRRRLNESAQ